MEKYTDTARHFDVTALPPLLQRCLPVGPLAFADLGCGDGPLFRALAVDGFISPERQVYAVDLEPARLARVSARFPWIETVVASVDSVREIGDGTLDFVTSTMVMEHVPDERAYLDEMARVLRPGGRGYVTTVFKKSWAWYFRKRAGSVGPRHVASEGVHRSRRVHGAPDRGRPFPGPPAGAATALVPGPGSCSLPPRRAGYAANEGRVAPERSPVGEGPDPGILQPRGRARALISATR